MTHDLSASRRVRVMNRMLNNPFSPRLPKKVQVQGGVTHPADGYPGPSETYSRYVATSARACQRRTRAFFGSL